MHMIHKQQKQIIANYLYDLMNFIEDILADDYVI